MFSNTKGRQRTDQEFRNYADKQHHKSKTILTENPFVADMIYSFPIDPMHGVDLGPMRKILMLFIFHKILDPNVADPFLLQMCKFIPSDYVRRPRSLKTIDYYKATEFRLFALYLGPVLFKLCNINTTQYENFLNFFISYRLLMGEDNIVSEENCNTAEVLLQNFVSTFKNIFEELSFNFHNLLHLVEGVRRHGPLHKYSAYKYENFYFLLREWIRKPSDILQQTWTRWMQTRGAVQRKLLKRRTFGAYLLDCSERNNCIMTHNGDIRIITKKICNLDGVFLETKKFRNREEFFTSPVNSSTLHIYVVSHNDLVDADIVQFEQVKRKMFRIPFENKFVIMPILHY